MKRRIFGFVFVVVCCLSSPKYTGATLNSTCFTPHYSKYVNRSIGSNNNTIIQTVQVSGYTEALNPAVYMGPQQGYQYPCTSQASQMQSATHTSTVRNVVGSTGGDYSQGPTPALNYNSYSITITAAATPGTIYPADANTAVLCAIAGQIFLANLSDYVEIAFTITKNNCTSTSTAPYYSCPGSGGPGNWPVTLWCDASFSPPDYPPTYSQNPSNWPFFNQAAICVRFGGAGWFCYSPSQNGQLGPDGGLSSSQILDPNNPHEPCTHNP